MLIKLFSCWFSSKNIVKNMIMIFYEFGNAIYFELRFSNSYDRICSGNTINLSFFYFLFKNRSFSYTHIEIHSQRRNMRLLPFPLNLVLLHQYLKVYVNFIIPKSFISFLNIFLFFSLCSHLFSSF